MIGAVLIVIALFLIPVVVIVTMAFVAMGLGWFLREDAEQRYEGSELLDVNV